MSTEKPGAAACDEQSLVEFLDGSLPVHRRPLVESHLERCQACRRNLAGFEQTLAMTSTVPVPAMDPFVSSGFGAGVRRGIEERVGWRSWGRRWSPAFPGAIAGAAAVLLVLAASDLLTFVEPGLPAGTGIVREQGGEESPDSPGIDEFRESVTLWYGDEIQLYGGDFLTESSPPDLDSEVSRYLLETASESELFEQMQLLVEGEDIYALTAE